MTDEPFTFSDKRRIDPETLEVREPSAPAPEESGAAGAGASMSGGLDAGVATDVAADAAAGVAADATGADSGVGADSAQLAELENLVAERTADLQRLQAEYQNYKRRVDRDRDLARQAGIEAVVTDLMPILDSVVVARQHGEIDGGFKLVVDELERVATKYDLAIFGEVGDAFDPAYHDALMQLPHSEPVEVSTISQVMQSGIRLGERVLRPARVAVAEPE